MLKIKFSVNWNNKLNCNHFTTVRLKNEAIFYKGAQAAIFMKSSCIVQDNRFPEERNHLFMFNADIVHVANCNLNDLPEFFCLTDTGYDKLKCTNMLRTMYKNNEKAGENPEMSIIVLKRSWEKNPVATEAAEENKFHPVSDII